VLLSTPLKMLLDRLFNQFGVSDEALDWFLFYLSDRSQSVFVNRVSSRVRLSRPVCPRVLFLDLFSSHHTRPLHTTLHVFMVYVLTSTLMTLNSQLNFRLMVSRLRIVDAWMKQGTG
jgi:hypothetical protein